MPSLFTRVQEMDGHHMIHSLVGEAEGHRTVSTTDGKGPGAQGEKNMVLGPGDSRQIRTDQLGGWVGGRGGSSATINHQQLQQNSALRDRFLTEISKNPLGETLPEISCLMCNPTSTPRPPMRQRRELKFCLFGVLVSGPQTHCDTGGQVFNKTNSNG